MTLKEFKDSHPDAVEMSLHAFFTHVNEPKNIPFEKIIFRGSSTSNPFKKLAISNTLNFRDCFFDVQRDFFLNDTICESFVIFTNCYFKESIIIHEGDFKEGIFFYNGKVPAFELSGGVFKDIIFSKVSCQNIYLFNGEFRNFMIFHGVDEERVENFLISETADKLGNIQLQNISINELTIRGVNNSGTYLFYKIKCNLISILNFTNNSQVRFFQVEPIDKQKTFFHILFSNLNKTEFIDIDFSKFNFLNIKDSVIIDSLFVGCKWGTTISSFDIGSGYLNNATKEKLKEQSVGIKEVYRQLRYAMSKHSDKINETAFYAKEMNLHNRLLPLTFNTFWDKLILYLSKWTSNYGQSFGRPLFFLFAFHFVLFNIAILSGAFNDIHFTLNPNWDGFRIVFENYFVYINPFRSLNNSLPGFTIFWDFLMRVSASYMIYNIVRASRRFIA